MRPRADRPVNKSCEVTVPGSPGRGNGENRPSGQPAADNRSGPAVSRKPESDRLLGKGHAALTADEKEIAPLEEFERDEGERLRPLGTDGATMRQPLRKSFEAYWRRWYLGSRPIMHQAASAAECAESFRPCETNPAPWSRFVRWG